ncbi:MAG: hypothetical protein PF508_14955 [Spirochaeta sp.]|jgi:hypothetical protein|nr:hypothetical protein [Spirochaeta sp.]
MSTIRSTRDSAPAHTVVGHTPPAADSGGPTLPAIVLLNRSSRLLRRELLVELVEAGYREIISVEPSDRSYTVESLTREFEQVRFILIDQSVNTGEAINLAVAYLHAEYMVVIWSTMSVPQGIDRALQVVRAERFPVCVAPLLRGERSEALPTVQAPALHRKSLRIIPLPVRGDGGSTVFPFDYVGLYAVRGYRHIGGFDPLIAHPFWQKLDFGFRVHLWGGVIPVLPTFRISYRSMPEPEDQTINESYARFYAKNLAVKVTEQGARIPRFSALRFAVRSHMGLASTLKVFRNVRLWLMGIQHNVRVDPRDLVDRWRIEHE